MQRLRLLVLAQGANPESICGPLIAYSQAQALARIHDVTLVIGAQNEEAVRRNQGALHKIEVIHMPLADRAYAWLVTEVFKANFNNQMLQLFIRPFSVLFELRAWQKLKSRIQEGEFDAILRILPVSIASLSPFAFFARNVPAPLIVGPVNGGLPWPVGFKQSKIQNRWVTGLRNLQPWLPFGGSTYRHAAAVVAGSSHAFAELSRYCEKLFFLPENGIDSSICFLGSRVRKQGTKLELIFIGSLIPLKACDIALKAAAPLLRKHLAHFIIVGDGPERSSLEELAQDLGIADEVEFAGWLSHERVMVQLRAADVLLFPSIRDFGGGVVFEALASGVVPVVADFGGPGDIVHSEVGCKVTLTNETDVVSQIEHILTRLEQEPELLDRLRRQGVTYARDHLSWDAKAQTISSIMLWVLGLSSRPNLPPPKLMVR